MQYRMVRRSAAIAHATSVTHWLGILFAQNCLLGAVSLTHHAGGLDLAGTHHWDQRCECTASRLTLSTPDMDAAIAIRGAKHMLHNRVYRSATPTSISRSARNALKLIAWRADLNLGHGWMIDGGSGSPIGREGLTNSQASDRLFGTWLFNGGHFLVIGCYAATAASVTCRIRSPATIPLWAAARMGRRSTASARTSRARRSPPPIPPYPIATGDAATKADGPRHLYATNTAATTNTDFDQGQGGQRLAIRGDGFTTLQHNRTIKNAGGADLRLATDRLYSYVMHNGVRL